MFSTQPLKGRIPDAAKRKNLFFSFSSIACNFKLKFYQRI